MNCVPEKEGYDETVGERTRLFKGGNFTPAGDPDKTAKAMMHLVDNPQPPVHFLLGTDDVSRINKRTMEETKRLKWLPVGISTDATDTHRADRVILFSGSPPRTRPPDGVNPNFFPCYSPQQIILTLRDYTDTTVRT